MDRLTLKEKIEDLTLRIEEKKTTARYLSGNKKGAWSRITEADKKRSYEISNLISQLDNLKNNTAIAV